MFDCEEFRRVAGAVLEGESHPEAYAHLDACPRCRLLVDELGAIERAARALPVHQPSDQLWGRLETVATREGFLTQPAWWQWSGPAWSLLPARPAFAGLWGLTLLLAAGLVTYPPLELPVAPRAATPFEVARGELVGDASYGTRYQAHLQQVEHSVLGEEAAPVDTELRALVSRPLNTVDRAIEQTELRLADYPDDALAREELHRLYRQKATVLQAMSDPVWLDVGP